jgi:hypothetical protein
MYYFILIVCFIFIRPLIAKDINISSIIILDQNIPKECGINISVVDEDVFNTKVLIKKNKNNQTSTLFSSESKDIKVFNSDVRTENLSIVEIINADNKNSNKIKIENVTDQNQTSQFFQELLIFGATVLLNDKEYELKGPIDSKVRLEYLFCTGEMFLPNYQKKK